MVPEISKCSENKGRGTAASAGTTGTTKQASAETSPRVRLASTTPRTVITSFCSADFHLAFLFLYFGGLLSFQRNLEI